MRPGAEATVDQSNILGLVLGPLGTLMVLIIVVYTGRKGDWKWGRESDDRIADLVRVQTERVAELNRVQAERVAELNRVHAERVAEMQAAHAARIADMQAAHKAQLEAAERNATLWQELAREGVFVASQAAVAAATVPTVKGA